MNIRFRNFIYNGWPYGLFFFAISLIMGYVVMNQPLNNVLRIAVPTRVLTFVANGLFQGRFAKSVRKLDAIEFTPEESETVTLSSPANHTVDDQLIPGKLALTDKRLVFLSFQGKEYSWNLADLKKFKFYPGVVNSGGEFLIEDINQSTLVFEVDEIRKWKLELSPMMLIP